MTDLVIIGDSISAPFDAGAWTTGQGYGALICAAAGLTEVNFAVSSTKVADMQTQTDAACARSPKPRGVVWMLPSNDIQAGTNVTTFQDDLDGQVAQLINAGIPVTVMTTFPRQIPSSWATNAPPYLQAIRAVAAKYRVTLIDTFAMMAEKSLTLSSTDYMALFYTGDGINAHPTALGQQVIAAQFHLPQAMGSAAYSVTAAAPTGMQWSPTDKSSGVDLSSDGLTASCGLADKAVRSVAGKTSGKWFFKLRKNTGGNNVVLGVARSTAARDYPGVDNDGWGYWSYNGKTFHGNAQTVCGSALADGTTLYGYLDADAGKLWFGNSTGWFGNPEVGTGAAYSGLTGPLFLMFGTTNPSPTSSVTIDTSDDVMRGSANLWV